MMFSEDLNTEERNLVNKNIFSGKYYEGMKFI